MDNRCVPYPRKKTYLLLSIPLLVIMGLLGIYLFQNTLPFFFIYIGLILIAVLAQSYCCAYQSCPYIGRFCPGIGGFLFLSSRLAPLYRGLPRSKILFEILAFIGFVGLVGANLLPLYFLFQLNVLLMILYLIFVLAYFAAFLTMICPFCAIRSSCPGGKLSTKLFPSPKA